MRRALFAFSLLFAFAASALDFSYVMTGDGHAVISGGHLNVDRVVSLADRLGNRVIWAKIDGEQYLIRDAATYAQARAAFRDTDELHAEASALRERMDPLEEREEKLERQIDRITDDLSDRPDDFSAAERRKMEQRRDELERQIEPVQDELRKLEEEEERIDDREEVLVAAAEKKLRQIIERAIASGVAQKY
jgi:chromosome segregation ATPase